MVVTPAISLKNADNLRKQQKYQEALRAVYEYLDQSSDPDGYLLLGTIFREIANMTGGIRHSEMWLRKALETRRSPIYEGTLGLTLLQQAKWREGWSRYEARKETILWDKAHKGVPLWAGQPLDGKRVLVFQEQGLGDMMQFAGFLPQLKERGARTVTMHCHPQLETLLRGSAERLRIDKVIVAAEPDESHDLQVPQMSLPGLLQESGTAAARVPYLIVPADTPPLIPPARAGCPPRVALNWACKKDCYNYSVRSCPIVNFRPLAQAGFEVYSVQKELSEQEAEELDRLGFRNLSANLTDLARTAGVLRSVQAVLTVDTAVAHLAGALDVDTVLMLHDAADWRWHDDRETSRWYPRVRIVRQKASRRWTDVIADAVAILRNILQVGRGV